MTLGHIPGEYIYSLKNTILWHHTMQGGAATIYPMFKHFCLCRFLAFPHTLNFHVTAHKIST